MRKYWVVTFTVLMVLFAFVLLLSWAPVAAQQAGAGSVKVTPSAVTRVTLIKVNPGQRPAFDQDVMDNLIPVYDEEKKAGILTNYEIFNNVTTNTQPMCTSVDGNNPATKGGTETVHHLPADRVQSRLSAHSNRR